MRIPQLFIKSLYSLKSIALFRFQKIEKTISYLFVLSFIVSLPTLALFFISFFSNIKSGQFHELGSFFQELNEQQTINAEGAASGIIPVFIFLTFLFILLSVSMIQFITTSLLAGVGLLLKRVFQRRLDYKQLWNMSTYAVTLPSVIVGLSVLLPFSLPLPYLIYFLLAFIILFFAIQKVPKPKIKK